jgi:hypothetical protein
VCYMVTWIPMWKGWRKLVCSLWWNFFFGYRMLLITWLCR